MSNEPDRIYLNDEQWEQGYCILMWTEPVPVTANLNDIPEQITYQQIKWPLPPRRAYEIVPFFNPPIVLLRASAFGKEEETPCE